MKRNAHYDVVIVGGGPAGSTTAGMLRLYQRNLRVLVLERERFPRDHVGESQLPLVSHVLHELGVWEKVESAGFPVKIGATYRWGKSDDLWDLEFAPGIQDEVMPRPGKFEGPRTNTAFQVDRAIYDKILLDHASELGAEVREGSRVVSVESNGDSVSAVILEDGSQVTADWYVDASGHTGIVRRAMQVGVTSPTSLRNIAIWDYWQNADWAVEIGTGGTRVQVMSLGYGWIWFIPLGPTRTSVGLVVPAEYFKASGKKPSALYHEAIQKEPRISALMRRAVSENKLATTKDWSFVADRLVGDNWFLAGESAGFADPILAAGMTLAHVGAKEAAYTILELKKGRHEAAWLKEQYNEIQLARLMQHIRFADFWYTHNGHFKDLQEYTAQIAADAGLNLSGKDAFRWLGTGGFANDRMGMASVATFSITPLKEVTKRFTGDDPTWEFSSWNVFDLNLKGANMIEIGHLGHGEIEKITAYRRDSKQISAVGVYWYLLKALHDHRDLDQIINALAVNFKELGGDTRSKLSFALEALETLVIDGWVIPSYDATKPQIRWNVDDESRIIHRNRDCELPNSRVPDSLRGVMSA